MSQERDPHWANSARTGDWTNAALVALVLSIAVVLSAIAIALFDNSARVASRYSTSMSELSTTAQAGGAPETDGKAR